MNLAVKVLLVVAIVTEVRSAVVICQFASWAVYRPTGGTFEPDMINTNLCTHGVYVTAGLDANDQVVSSDPWADLETGGGKGGYNKFTGLKATNPSFKALLALGGFANAAYQFAAIAADPARRTVMAQSTVDFLKLYGFDGIELDWLYPATANEKANFPLLLAEIRRLFEPEGFQIIVTGAALENTITLAYDLPAVSEQVNYLVMIGYDYEGAWNPWTGLSTPLYVEDSHLCVNATVSTYLSGGMNPAKLVLGFPGFGRSYTLADPAQHGVNDSAVGPGDAGPYTRTNGIISFNEIAEFISNGWTVGRDTLSQAPYTYKGNQWISMDDATSVAFKAEYCVSKGLAGGALWTIDEDNFVGGAFTLLTAISNGFGN